LKCFALGSWSCRLHHCFGVPSVSSRSAEVRRWRMSVCVEVSTIPCAEVKHKCRGSPQRSNGGHTLIPSAMSAARHTPPLLPRSPYCGQASAYMGRRGSPLDDGGRIRGAILRLTMLRPREIGGLRSTAPTRRHACEKTRMRAGAAWREPSRHNTRFAWETMLNHARVSQALERHS
jgi:hypothetical protein